MYVPDNHDAFRRHDAEQESTLAKLPECSGCGEKIMTEECYEIGGELFCLNCIEENKVYTEDYVR